MNSKLANVFLSFLLPAMLLTGCSELATNTNESDKPFYLEFDSTQADSLNVIKYSQLTTDKFKLFCNSDDFTILPHWSIYS